MEFLKSLYMDMKGSAVMLMPVDLAGRLGFITDQEAQIKRNINNCNSLIPNSIDLSYTERVHEVDEFFILIRQQLERYGGFYKEYFSERFEELKQRDREALGFR